MELLHEIHKCALGTSIHLGASEGWYFCCVGPPTRASAVRAAVCVKQLVGRVQHQFDLRRFLAGRALAWCSHPLSPGSRFAVVHSNARFSKSPG